jgi:hypothetical protein
MPKPLWFAFYPSDWLTDATVMAMPLAQQGAYIRLLCLAACNDGIPADPEPLIGSTGVWAEPMRSCWIPHPTKPGYLHNPRLLKELERADAKREAGTKAANTRHRNATAMRPQCDRNASRVEESREEKRGDDDGPVGDTIPAGLPDEYRTDYLNLRKTVRVPSSLDLELRTLLAGRHPSAEGATPDDVGRGIRELILSGRPPNGLANWVRTATRTRKAGPKSTDPTGEPPDEWDRLRAKLRAEEAATPCETN